MTIFSTLRRSMSHTPPSPWAGLDISTRTDSRGFNQAMITDTTRRQITVSSTVDNAMILNEAQIKGWNTAVADTERMMVSFAADSTSSQIAPLIGATFRPTGKAERKDLTELATWLTINAPTLYDSATHQGLDATPADEPTLATRTAALLSASDKKQGHTVHTLAKVSTMKWTDHADHVQVASQGFSVFTVATSVPGVAEDLDDLFSTWDLPAQLTRTRWMRPYAHPELLAELNLSDPGRMWATVTVAGGAGSDTAFIKALHPATRLHTRRAYLRQSMLLTGSLGLGIVGFQNLELDRNLLS